MAVTTQAELEEAATRLGKRIWVRKQGAGGENPGVLGSYWTAAGMPAAGAAAGSLNGANCDSATAGALPLWTPGGSRSLFLADVVVGNQDAAAIIQSLLLYDRVWHNSAMSGTATGSNAITQPALPSRVADNGLGLRLAVEVYTAWGTNAVNCTVNYTDADSAAQSLSFASVVPGGSGAPAAGVFSLLPLANNRGVKSVTSYGWASTTGTAGNFGLTLLRPLAWIGWPAMIRPATRVRDWMAGQLVTIPTGACLAFAGGGGALGATVNFGGYMTIAEQ